MARPINSRTRVWNRKPKARDRAWQSMRILRRFDVPSLSSTAEIGVANAGKYLRGLLRSGYIRIIKPKSEGRKGGHACYQLIRDTGPKAPRLQSNGDTYDPNEHKVYPGGLSQ